MSITEATRQYWLDTVLGWAEARLMPPQFDECKRALTQAVAERDAYQQLAKAYGDARQDIEDHVAVCEDCDELNMLCDFAVPMGVIKLSSRRELYRLSRGLTDAATALAALARAKAQP
jgi:hypothetical protein